MYQYKGLEDTIAAIATPAGQGGIGIVRISGKEAIIIADTVLCLQGNKALRDCKSHTVQYGWVKRHDVFDIAKDEEILDEVLVTLMRAPKSYTTEDIVEI